MVDPHTFMPTLGDRPPAERRTRPSRRRAVSAFSVALVMLIVGGVGAASGQDSVADAKAERDQVREQRAEAAAELDAAKAEDAELADALTAVDEAITAQEAALVDAQRQLDVARVVATQAEADVVAAAARADSIRAELGSVAVDGFVAQDRHATPIYFETDDLTEALRRNTMLQLADTDTADLLEEMRMVQEDGDLAQAIADAAVEQAIVIEAGMAQTLIDLEVQRTVQAGLKAELESRVVAWEAQVAEFEADEARLAEFIREEEARMAAEAAAAAAAAAANPSTSTTPDAPDTTSTTNSSSGFRWPVSAPVTSEYGWRIHPIYGTKRLHAGIDLGAMTGTPIVASAGGTVIQAGVYGGYGNTVIISHGNGISTLYAHQSKIEASNGDRVERGDVIGYVGSTGNSTGPHLHFEIRVSGDAVNPRGYLP